MFCHPATVTKTPSSRERAERQRKCDSQWNKSKCWASDQEGEKSGRLYWTLKEEQTFARASQVKVQDVQRPRGRKGLTCCIFSKWLVSKGWIQNTAGLGCMTLERPGKVLAQNEVMPTFWTKHSALCEGEWGRAKNVGKFPPDHCLDAKRGFQRKPCVSKAMTSGAPTWWRQGSCLRCGNQVSL